MQLMFCTDRTFPQHALRRPQHPTPSPAVLILCSHLPRHPRPQVLSAPGLPVQLYREELVTALISLVKFHLQVRLVSG